MKITIEELNKKFTNENLNDKQEILKILTNDSSC